MADKEKVQASATKLRENADLLKQFMDSFYEAKREAHDSMFGRPYGIEERVVDLLTLVQRLTASVYQGLNDCADALAEPEAAVTNKSEAPPNPAST